MGPGKSADKKRPASSHEAAGKSGHPSKKQQSVSGGKAPTLPHPHPHPGKPGPPSKKQQDAAPPAAAQAKPPVPEQAGKKGKKKSEIDDIFGLGKSEAVEEEEGVDTTLGDMTGEMKDIAERIKKARAEKAVASKPAPAAPAAKQPKLQGSKDDIFGGDAGDKGRKRTEEGYAIYSEAELGMGSKGGDTDLCPFDCDCCF